MGPAPDWLTAVRRYLFVSAAANLLWETAQMPLYTLWRAGTPYDVMTAILHCTAGDVAIAAAALLGALVTLGQSGWPSRRRWPVEAGTILAGLGYTLYSEYVNTVVRQAQGNRISISLDRFISFLARFGPNRFYPWGFAIPRRPHWNASLPASPI